LIISPTDPVKSYDINYKSSNNDVISVDGNGEISARKEGESRITAEVISYSGNQQFTSVDYFDLVSKYRVRSISLRKNIFEAASDRINFRDKIYADNVVFEPVNATNRELTYKSNNPDIATVDGDGVVTVKKAGVVTFTVMSNDDNDKTAQFNILFTNGHATKITIENLSGGAVSHLYGQDNNVINILQYIKEYAPTDFDKGTLHLESSNVNVAQIDGSGKVKIVGGGEAFITIIADTYDGEQIINALPITVSRQAEGIKIDNAAEVENDPTFDNEALSSLTQYRIQVSVLPEDTTPEHGQITYSVVTGSATVSADGIVSFGNDVVKGGFAIIQAMTDNGITRKIKIIKVENLNTLPIYGSIKKLYADNAVISQVEMQWNGDIYPLDYTDRQNSGFDNKFTYEIISGEDVISILGDTQKYIRTDRTSVV
jgi:uncharacterized protein YjdB